MIAQKKYYMIILLSISGFSYGMDKYFETDKEWLQDPLVLHATLRHLEIQRTTWEINASLKEVSAGSNGYYEKVERRGVITVVRQTNNMLEQRKNNIMPKL